MPSAPNSVKAALSHAEGEAPSERSAQIRVRPGKTTVSVKRLGTAAGKLTVYKTNDGESRSKVDSKSWGDDSTDVVKEVTIETAFLVLVAEFTDSNFGQVEVTITSS